MVFCAVSFFCARCPHSLLFKQAEAVLEVFCVHASQRISQLQQDLASMREFRGLLKETQTQLVIDSIFFPGVHVDTPGGGSCTHASLYSVGRGTSIAILLM